MNTSQPLVIDDNVKSVIGKRGNGRTALDVASTSEMRRFAHAIFDDNKIYFDEQAAGASRFGVRVGPGPFILTCMRPNIPFTDDPLRHIGLHEDVPSHRDMRPLPKGWDKRYEFHAGDEVEFFRLPHEGDRVSAQPYVKDIYLKSGRNGNLAFYITRTEYKDQNGQIIGSHDTHLAFPEESGEQRRQRNARSPAAAQPAGETPTMQAAKPLDLPRVDFDDIKVGYHLPSKLIRITVPIVVRWAMATEAYRRDHYDSGFAVHEGHSNIIASGLWALSCRWAYISHFAGRDGWVWKVSHQLRARMNVGDTLTASAVVTDLQRHDKYGLVQLDVKFTNQNGVAVAPGAATVALPYSGGPAVPYPFVAP